MNMIILNVQSCNFILQKKKKEKREGRKIQRREKRYNISLQRGRDDTISGQTTY